jgi:DNA-binding transcriptional LysR family regulator
MSLRPIKNQARESWTFLSLYGEIRVPVNGRFKSNNAEVLRELAHAGTGIALLPEWLIDQDIADGQLVELFENSPAYPDNAKGEVSALYLPNHRGSKRVKAFMGFMQYILGQWPLLLVIHQLCGTMTPAQRLYSGRLSASSLLASGRYSAARPA